MALNILSLSPADNSVDVPNDSNLVITFNETVLKGQGNIYVVRQSTGTLGQAIDVNSSNVVVSGSQVTIDLPTDLPNDNTYSVIIDSGAFIDSTTGKTAGSTVFTQNFDLLPLGPFVFERGGTGNDFTLTPPQGMNVDNSQMGTGGMPEWFGWSFANKASWLAAEDQQRSEFTLGQNTVAIADPDEWFDRDPVTGRFNSFLATRPINLSGVTANSLSLEFDSSFRPEDPSVGKVQFTSDGTNWTDLLTFLPRPRDAAQQPLPEIAATRNQKIVIDSSTPVGTFADRGYTIDNRLVNSTTGTIQFRWGLLTGENDWWWAVDNLKVTGEVTGVPFGGISNPTTWNFTTPDSLALSVAIDRASMSENGGTAVGTVTRNKQFTDPLVVNLTSSDTSEATVPLTVTIPAGQSSVTFPITAVDDLLSDRTQVVRIDATATAYEAAAATIDVLDDEGPKVVTLSPIDNSIANDYRTNLVMTLDVAVKKGNGLINILRASDNVLVTSIDVNSANVTVAGTTVTINPPVDLPAPASYYVLMDDGTFLDTTTNVTPNTILMAQNFDLLPLGPFTGGESGGDGTDVTRTPPTGFSIDNSGMSGGATSNWFGWTFADPNAWAKGAAPRNQFTSGTGVIAVADPVRWGQANPSVFNSLLTTAPISLTDVAANSVSLEFDSAYQGSGILQNALVQVSYNNGPWIDLAVFDGTGVNNRIVINSAGVTGSPAVFPVGSNRLQNPSSGTMRFRFTESSPSPSGFWAIDNLKVVGQTTGVPFQGISDASVWNFDIERPTLTVSIDRATMPETGGSAVGMVTRNILTRDGVVVAPEITVALTSSDTSEATVPATIVIPAGATTSATFPIIAVDDALADGTQSVTITATSAPEYLAGTATIQVLDVAFSPADNSTAVPVGTNLTVTFDQPVVKGNGFVHLVRASDNKLGMSIDIQSSAVTVAGNVVTIDPPANLARLTDYYVLFGTGAILYPSATPVPDVTLLFEDFELLPLGPAVIGPGFNANGQDFTATPPAGFAVDNSQMPPGGVPEFYGWTFVDKTFWIVEGGDGVPGGGPNGGQHRDKFTLGSGTVAVADNDEWDDVSRPNNFFNSLFSTSPIDLSTVAANSVKLEFDSSFRPEGPQTATLPANNQIGIVEVSYDGGTSWIQLEQLDKTNTSGAIPNVPSPPVPANVNERKSITVPNPASGSMKFRFGLTGTNDFWWAIDNVRISGSTLGTPFAGTVDPTAWNFTTADTETLSVSLNVSSIVENGGTATGTVTRNLVTGEPVVVTLVSSDTASASVPTTVTIPAGQASVNFTVTAVDDAVADGLKKLTISASATGFVNGSVGLNVTDNEIVDVIISEIMFDPAGAEPRSEWIEVYNRGTVAADLSGWSFDDEDTTNWGAIPQGTLVQPGKTAVIYNSFFGLNTDTMFRNVWNVPADVPVVGVFWGVLDATPSATNERLVLVDSGNQLVDSLINEAGLPVLPAFPAAANGFSIYLSNPLLNNNDGSNWKVSALGVDSARSTIQAGITVSEVHPTGSSNSTYAADWFELTNSGTTAVDITGWKVDDNSNSFASAVDLQLFSVNAQGVETPVTSIAAGQVVVFLEGDAAKRTAFRAAWGASLPSGFLLGSYSGSGVGLSSGGDDVRIFDAAGNLVTFVTFGAATPGVTFENTARLTGVITELSQVGKNNGAASASGGEVGSPGRTATTFSANDVGSPGQVPDFGRIYHKGSFFSAGGTDVTSALDPVKVMARAGAVPQTLTYNNLINSTRGINGVALDIAGLASTSLTAADFVFRMSPTGLFDAAANPPSAWETAPALSVPPTVTPGSTSRVLLEWADGTIMNRWLQIIVRANSNTGLSAPQVYYVGHLQGELNGQVIANAYFVNNADIALLPPIGGGRTSITDNRDIDKNSFVNNFDGVLVRNSIIAGLSLRNLTIPAAGTADEGIPVNPAPLNIASGMISATPQITSQVQATKSSEPASEKRFCPQIVSASTPSSLTDLTSASEILWVEASSSLPPPAKKVEPTAADTFFEDLSGDLFETLL